MQSRAVFVKDGKVIAAWEEGRWPDAAFYDVMHSKVLRCEMPDDRSRLYRTREWYRDSPQRLIR